MFYHGNFHNAETKSLKDMLLSARTKHSDGPICSKSQPYPTRLLMKMSPFDCAHQGSLMSMYNMVIWMIKVTGPHESCVLQRWAGGPSAASQRRRAGTEGVWPGEHTWPCKDTLLNSLSTMVTILGQSSFSTKAEMGFLEGFVEL